MTTNEMITELTQTVSLLQKDVDYLYKKLEQAYDDRIALRAEKKICKKRLKSFINLEIVK